MDLPTRRVLTNQFASSQGASQRDLVFEGLGLCSINLQTTFNNIWSSVFSSPPSAWRIFPTRLREIVRTCRTFSWWGPTTGQTRYSSCWVFSGFSLKAKLTQVCTPRSFLFISLFLSSNVRHFFRSKISFRIWPAGPLGLHPPFYVKNLLAFNTGAYLRTYFDAMLESRPLAKAYLSLIARSFEVEEGLLKPAAHQYSTFESFL